MPGEAGKRVGYIQFGGELIEITTIGSSDSQTEANTLPAGGTLKIDVGSDLVIWTKHFTKFVTYTQASRIAALSSGTFTVSSNTIADVPYGTDKATFLAALTKGQADQTWDDSGIDDIVASGNTLVSTAQDGVTAITYTVSIKIPITAGSIGSDQSICVGVAAPLTETEAPTGGSGIFTYQWQNSADGSIFTNISGATSKGYSPDTLSQTTWYRRLVSSPGFNSPPVSSNTVKITTVPVISNNTIQTPLQTGFCQSVDPLTLSGSIPSGGNGTYTYQWQNSADGITFSNISGAISRNYVTPKLTDTIYYQRIVTSGSCILISSQIALYVTRPLTNNVIIAPDLVEFDASGDPEMIRGTIPTNGDGNYVYQWQSSIISETNGFENITGAESKDYNPGVITKTTWYRRQVTYGFCVSSSTPVKITVQPEIQNNELTYTGQALFCENGDPAIITGGLPTGGNGIFTYQWRSSTTNANNSFSDIIGATSKDYNPGVITQTTWFRREVTSGAYQDISNAITIIVTPAVTNNIISGEQTIASGTKPTGLTGLLPSGGTGTYTYLWESSITGASGFAPAEGLNTSQNYNPAILTQTTVFRRKVTSGTCNNVPLISNSVQITISSINNPPLASNDSYTVLENTALMITAPGVLQNDTDPDNNSLSASVVTQPTHGTLILNSNGSFTYTPAANYTGTDSFTYRACDNGSPQLCSDTKTVTLTITGNPVIGIAKLVNPPVLQSDGTYNLTFSITVRNMGTVDLTNVQVTDDLAKAFPAPLSYTVVNAPVTNGSGLTGNTLFNGVTNKNLLLYGSNLTKGTSGTIAFTVNVNINGGPGKFNNTATATATGQGTMVSDISTSGSNPDPDNNGRPDENEPTLISLNGNAMIGLAKSVSTPIRQLDGKNSNILTYKITVKNYGNVPLNDVQVIDDLSKTFPFPAQVFLEGIPSSSKGILRINSGFDGKGNGNLLQSGNVLAPSQSDTISFKIKVTPDNDMMGPFDNSASASAKDPNGMSISDISASGTNPDPDNNGNPDESSVTRVMLEKATVRIPEGFSPNGDGIIDNFVIENLDNQQISLQIFNQLGTLIYKNDNYQNEWNGICNQGSYSGKDIPDGTYFYIVSKRNNKENYTRFITIKR